MIPRWALALFLLVPAALAAHAEQAPAAADRAAIETVIRAQLDAFRRDDAAAAFSYAAPAIRTMFGDPATFLAMVSRSYQPVYRPRVVEFRELLSAEGRPVQKVFVIGPDGAPWIALYVMARAPGGDWLIDGCFLTKAADEGA